MRYFIRDTTLLIRGTFIAASTGIRGGVKYISTILNHTVPTSFDHTNPEKYLDQIVAGFGYPQDYFGLLTAVDMHLLCILHYDFITAFITAGISNPNPQGGQTINIIIHSREPLSEGALLETIITATEAKAHALQDMHYSFFGTSTDAVVVACDPKSHMHTYAGTLTEAGRRVYECVHFGVQQALKRHLGEVVRTEPSFFIFSRYGGSHWVEWAPRDCPYYPCHFPGQRCDFCYCPFYPCEDEDLGAWVESSSGGVVWSCQNCDLVHLPEVADYLNAFPEASLKEIKKIKKQKKTSIR